MAKATSMMSKWGATSAGFDVTFHTIITPSATNAKNFFLPTEARLELWLKILNQLKWSWFWLLIPQFLVGPQVTPSLSFLLSSTTTHGHKAPTGQILLSPLPQSRGQLLSTLPPCCYPVSFPFVLSLVSAIFLCRRSGLISASCRDHHSSLCPRC